MKYLIVAALLVLGTTARADSIENYPTTDTVSVSLGCWNPALCSDPAAYWNALGFNVPMVEPPASDFASVGEPMVIDWTNNPPSWFIDTSLNHATVVATPEPGAFLLLLVGCLLL